MKLHKIKTKICPFYLYIFDIWYDFGCWMIHAVRCHVSATIIHCIRIHQNIHVLPYEIAICKFWFYFEHLAVGWWSLNNLRFFFFLVIKGSHSLRTKIFSSLLLCMDKFSVFSFTFMSPSLSHERLFSLRTLLRFPTSNVWMIHWSDPWWLQYDFDILCTIGYFLLWCFSWYIASFIHFWGFLFS